MKPDYAYPTINDYESCIGYPVGEAFKIGWMMARTTNSIIKQLAGEEPDPDLQLTIEWKGDSLYLGEAWIGQVYPSVRSPAIENKKHEAHFFLLEGVNVSTKIGSHPTTEAAKSQLEKAVRYFCQKALDTTSHQVKQVQSEEKDKLTRRLCDMITGNRIKDLTEENYKEMESIAMHLGHHKEILNAK